MSGSSPASFQAVSDHDPIERGAAPLHIRDGLAQQPVKAVGQRRQLVRAKVTHLVLAARAAPARLVATHARAADSLAPRSPSRWPSRSGSSGETTCNHKDFASLARALIRSGPRQPIDSWKEVGRVTDGLGKRIGGGQRIATPLSDHRRDDSRDRALQRLGCCSRQPARESLGGVEGIRVLVVAEELIGGDLQDALVGQEVEHAAKLSRGDLRLARIEPLEKPVNIEEIPLLFLVGRAVDDAKRGPRVGELPPGGRPVGDEAPANLQSGCGDQFGQRQLGFIERCAGSSTRRRSVSSRKDSGSPVSSVSVAYARRIASTRSSSRRGSGTVPRPPRPWLSRPGAAGRARRPPAARRSRR